MNKPNNRRRKASIEKLEHVFIELLQSRELNQISVTDVCKGAGLNRSTFYANYADIYALADSIRDKLESGLADIYREEIAQQFNSHDYLKLFRHIKENQIFYKTYFRLGYDDQYKIIAYDTALAGEHFQNHLIPYHMAFFKGGVTKIIKLWLQNGCQESPEEMFEVVKSEYQGRMTPFPARDAE